MPSQLSFMEREKISQMHFAKASGVEIAKALGRSRSTISRELTRNSTDGEYFAIQAQRQTESRKSNRPFEHKMSRAVINDRVRTGLVSFWSPEQISGRMKSDGLEHEARVSRSSIERWIRNDEHRKHWESFLRRRGKRKPENDRRGQLPSTVSITGRPAIAEDRSRCGDWEGDTIVSPGKRSGLVCSTDRLSGMLKLSKVKNLKSSEVIDKMRDQLRGLPANLRFTMTLDNGKEFAQHARLDKLLPEGVFFARPGHPWERGTNENTNGLIRQFVPKRTDISEVSHKRIQEIENLLNERPRKRHGYKTPNEVFTATTTKIRCV
jgi:transposase, IS30 family